MVRSFETIINKVSLLQTKHVLKKHQSETHFGRRTFECPICKKRLVRRQSLRDHKLMHINVRPHECTTCGKSFLRPSSLRTHMIVHSADSPFACDLCPARFKRSSVLKTHKLTHTGVRRFECDICKHRFHLKGALKHHILAHYGELVNILTASLRPAEEAEGVCHLIRPFCCTRPCYFISSLPLFFHFIETAGPLTSHINPAFALRNDRRGQKNFSR